MEIGKLMLIEPVAQPTLLKDLGQMDAASDAKKKQVAKDFEAVFIGKLLEQMDKTIGRWGLEKDSAHKQVDGIFSLYMADHLADSGGLGLWKDIYEFISGIGQTQTGAELLNEEL